jgi:hypothetical protein
MAELTDILPGDPWARWLFVALHRHLSRQRWVARIVEERLGGSIARLAAEGALGHPSGRAQKGQVPGLEQWSYFFHGIGCCLTHDDGTTIDVDFDEHGGDAIDPYFYARYLASLHEPEPIESALRAADALDGWWMADLKALRVANLVRGDHRLVLTNAGMDLASSLEPIIVEMGTTESPLRRAWLAILIGDLVRARDALGGFAHSSLVQQGAIDQLTLRIARLSGPYQKGEQADLRALAHLGREHAECVVLAQFLRSPLDAVTSAALEIAEFWGDVGFIEALIAVAERARGAEIPAPHIRVTACRIALRLSPADLPQGLRSRLCDLLRASTGASAGEGAFMLALLDYLPGIRALAAALNSEIPLARQDAAAGLMLLGTREATDVLRKSRAREAKLVLGSAPEHSQSLLPVAKWINWRGENRPTYSIEDILEAETPALLAQRTEYFRRVYRERLARFKVTFRS